MNVAAVRPLMHVRRQVRLWDLAEDGSEDDAVAAMVASAAEDAATDVQVCSAVVVST
jgi:hypothetical protein